MPKRTTEKRQFLFPMDFKEQNIFHFLSFRHKMSARWKKHLCLELFSVDLIRQRLGSFWININTIKDNGKRLQLEYLYTWKVPPQLYDRKTCNTQVITEFLCRDKFNITNSSNLFYLYIFRMAKTNNFMLLSFSLTEVKTND